MDPTNAVSTITTALLRADTADETGQYRRLYNNAMRSLSEMENEIKRLQVLEHLAQSRTRTQP